MPLESTIQRAIMRWLNTLPHCEAMVYTAHQRGRRGMPDILGALCGQMFLIEVKQPGATSRPDQVADQRKWRKAGALVGEVASLDEAKILLAPLLRDLDTHPF
jgi:hypothetical protein